MSALTTTWVAVVAGTTVSICAPALALTDEEIAESDRLLQAGEFQSAEALYRRAFERDPADAQAALRLIYSLIVQARTDEAAAYMDHMIARDYRYLSEYVSRWATHSHDPIAVLQAVLAISEDAERALALFSAAAAWASADSAAAQDWVLAMPMGPLRDAALAGLASAQAHVGRPPSPSVLSAFSTDLARQERLMTAIAALARHDMPAAQNLIDTYMIDADMRARAERLVTTVINRVH